MRKPEMTKESLFKASTHNLSGFLIQILVVFGSYPFLLRGLGIELVGVFLLMNSATFLWSLADLGVTHAVVQRVAKSYANNDKQQIADIGITAIFFYALVGITISIALWITANQLALLIGASSKHSLSVAYCIKITGPRFTFFFLAHVMLSILKGMQIYSTSMYLMSLQSLVTFGASAFLVTVSDVGLEDIMNLALAASVLMATIAFLAIRAKSSDAGWSISAGRVRLSTLFDLQKYGGFLAIITIANTGTTYLQRLLVSHFIGLQSVAAFSIGVTLFQRAQQALNALLEVLTPFSVSILPEHNLSKIRQTYNRATLLLGLIASIGALLLFLIAPLMVQTWLQSPIHTEVSEVIKILSVGLIATAISQPGYHIVNGLGKPRLNAIFSAIIPTVFFCLAGYLYLVGDLNLATITAAYTVALVLYAASFLAYLQFAFWPKLEKNKGA